MSENIFKLLAIRPLEDCEDRFLKNLTKGTIYKFYNEYSFKNLYGEEIKDGFDEVTLINYEPKVPINFYKIKDNLEVNISALVGKNGSGKSTLLELLYASCYVIASRKEILESPSSIYKQFKKNNQWLSESKREQLTQISSVYRDLYVELYYSIGDCKYCIKIEDGNISHRLISGENEKFIDGYYETDNNNELHLEYVLNEVFFYTISINYSLYGLNDIFLGNWIQELFHKNDGYQTPLVINPFRNNGIIDVNSELHLAQTRLLTNVINNESNNIVNGKKIETVVFELSTKKFKAEIDNYLDELYNSFKKEYGFSDSNFITNVYNRLYGGGFYGNVQILGNNRPNFEYQCKYVFRKIIKISQNYSEYNNWVKIDAKSKRVEFENFFTFLSELTDDRSHITLKLRQVLNNLRFNILFDDDENEKWIISDDKRERGNKYYKISLERLINRLKAHHRNGKFLFEDLIPIGCFNAILWVKNNEKDDSTNNLDVLSSGEQHFIHSIQSILYHLSNINSVFESNAKKIRYNYVNIILDEIELYYHPEFQRIFVSELLLRIKSLSIPNIKGINILFCTHSPFILSDIPIQNTLKLDDGKVKFETKNNNNTLGANIHDLLDNDFYLNNGFMGEFAKDRIFSLINFLSNEDNTVRFYYSWNKRDAYDFIELIGEPILKSTLREMYFSIYNDEIDREIERLNKLRKNK